MLPPKHQYSPEFAIRQLNSKPRCCTDAAINPGADEVCDAANVDEDCDGLADDADESATGQGTFYADDDGDSYGGPISVLSCDPPAGHVTDATDCDDTNATTFPGADEVLDDGVDQDCDGADAITPDADDTGAGEEDTGAGKDAVSCGCVSTGGAGVGGPGALVLLGALVSRRRVRHAAS